MADATDLPNMRERFERVRKRMGGGGGHGPTDDDTDRRLAALETGFNRLDGKLDKIIETQSAERLGNEQRFGAIAERLAAVEGKMASAADVARIAGRVESLPSTWQMITLVIGTVFTILGGSFLILKLGLPRGP